MRGTRVKMLRKAYAVEQTNYRWDNDRDLPVTWRAYKKAFLRAMRQS